MTELSVEEYHQLVEAGVLGPIELIQERVMTGQHEVVFSPAQQRAAAGVGVRVAGCVDAVLEDPESRAEVAARLAGGAEAAHGD